MMTLESVRFMLVMAVSSALLIAGILDFLYYKLPNKFFYFISGTFGFYMLAGMQWQLWTHWILFAIILGVGIVLFCLNVIGGGDVKIFAAAALWIGWENMIVYLLLTTIIGAGLAILYLLFKPYLRALTQTLREKVEDNPVLEPSVAYFVPNAHMLERDIARFQESNMIPYGVAIVMAAFIIMQMGIWQ